MHTCLLSVLHSVQLIATILSCQSIDPAGELHQCLSRFRCLFPSREAVLEPCTTLCPPSSVLLSMPQAAVPVCLCTVHKSVFDHWVAGVHQVVKDAAGFHDDSDSFMVSRIRNLLVRMPKAFSTTRIALDSQ